jgi:hypothetical protein
MMRNNWDLCGMWACVHVVMCACMLLSSASDVSAQSVGRLRLLVDPGNDFQFVVDGKYRMQQREVELSPGPHTFTFWAPQRTMKDTVLVVEAGRTRDVLLRLPFSAEYEQWQGEMERYRNDRKLRRLLPCVLTAGSLVYTAVKWDAYKKAHDQLNEDLSAYDEGYSPQAINILKDRTIPQHKDEFRNARTNFFLAAGLSTALAGATAYLFHRSAARDVPVFQDREKVRFDGLVWMPGTNGGEWHGGLTWNFAR